MAPTPSTLDRLKGIQSELGRLQLRCGDVDRVYLAFGVAHEALHTAWWKLQAGIGSGLPRVEVATRQHRDRFVATQ